MSKYKTRQGESLLSFLRRHPDELVSAQEIALALNEENISLTSVYRHLSELESAGKVRRCSRGNAREVYYQYMDADTCKGCLHLSCRRCGRTFHMDAEGAAQLLDTVARLEGFAVDKTETVLYGVCERCQKP